MAGCFTESAEDPNDEGPTEPPGRLPALRFTPTLYLDERISGSEPALEVGPDGTVYVSKHLSQQASRVWKSRDGGTTFEDVSPRPVAGQDRQAGVSGDGELAVDAANNVYYSDLYVASATLYASRDAGSTWTANPAASPVPGIDRQWIDAFGDGKLYLSGNQLPGGAWTSYSEDHGRTFVPGSPATAEGDALFEDRPIVDKSNGVLYVPLGSARGGEFVGITQDHARTWTLRPFPVVTEGLSMTWLSRDVNGTLYGATLEGEGNYSVNLRYSTDDALTWSTPVALPAHGGSKAFLWSRANETGHVAIAWFGTNATGAPGAADGQWDLWVLDVHSADSPVPNATLARVNTRPVKPAGVICTQGALCSGDRELGDFFEMEFGPDGVLHFAWAEFRGQGSSTVAYAHQVAAGAEP